MFIPGLRAFVALVRPYSALSHVWEIACELLKNYYKPDILVSIQIEIHCSLFQLQDMLEANVCSLFCFMITNKRKRKVKV